MDNFNHNELSREEILSLLMDGELQDANEQALFAEMAKDTDLQAQLKETLSMREAIKSDSEAFAPPPDVTAELFGKLGYADKPKITPVGFDWSRFMRRVAAPLMLLMLSITLPLIYNASTDKNIADASSVPVVSSESIDNDDQTLGSESITNTSKTTPEAYAKNTVASERQIASENSTNSFIGADDSYSENMASTLAVPAGNQNDFTAASMDNSIVSEWSHISESNVNVQSHANFALSNSNAMFGSVSFTMPKRHRADKEWSLHVRGIYNISRDGKSMQEFNPMKSFAAGMMMQLSDNIFMGLEGGREVYNFSNTIEGLYEDPYVFWYALSFRYNMPDLQFAGITPYLRVNGGGSSRGPVFATYLGGEYKLSDTYALTVAYGGSLLTYKSNNLQYATAKSGLNFGLNLRF